MKKFIQFIQDLVSINPFKEAGRTNCIMPILWVRRMYSGEVDLPKMPSVAEWG